MSLLVLLACVAGAGMAGGVANALLSDNAFLLPRRENMDGRLVIRPGALGNAVMGGLAAAITWGLYGPVAAVNLFGATDAEEHGLTLSALVGAMLAGVAGARWLTNEVDKSLLRQAASDAARAAGNPDAARRFLAMTPANVLSLARESFD